MIKTLNPKKPMDGMKSPLGGVTCQVKVSPSLYLPSILTVLTKAFSKQMENGEFYSNSQKRQK